MSKNPRKVERTNAPPGFLRFERHKPIDAAAAKLRKRAIAERLKVLAVSSRMPPQNPTPEGSSMSNRELSVKLTGWKAALTCFVLAWLIGSGAVATANMIWRAIQ